MIVRLTLVFTLVFSLSAAADEVIPGTLKCEGNASYPVHLTFDDGPKLPETEQILDILKKNGVQATFFISTSRLQGLRTGKPSENERKLLALIERMKREGHVIGSHSCEHIEHANPKAESADKVLSNMAKNDEVIAKLGLKEPVPFRFPFASSWFQDPDPANQAQGTRMMNQVKERGYKPVHWDIDTWDWSKIKRKALPQSMLRQICSHEGGVALLHDIQPFTAQNLQSIINSIKDSGHKLVSYEAIERASQARGADRGYVAFADKAAGIRYCGRGIGDFDQVWATCDEYRKKSTDLKRSRSSE